MSHMISWIWFIYNESSLLSHIEFGLLYSTTLTTFLFLFSHWINPISALWLVDLISAFALEQISSTLFQFTCDSFPWVIRMTHWWIIRWLTSVTTVTCSGALNHIWIQMLLSYTPSDAILMNTIVRKRTSSGKISLAAHQRAEFEPAKLARK